jgi:hypothetical protein
MTTMFYFGMFIRFDGEAAEEVLMKILIFFIPFLRKKKLESKSRMDDGNDGPRPADVVIMARHGGRAPRHKTRCPKTEHPESYD